MPSGEGGGLVKFLANQTHVKITLVLISRKGNRKQCKIPVMDDKAGDPNEHEGHSSQGIHQYPENAAKSVSTSTEIPQRQETSPFSSEVVTLTPELTNLSDSEKKRHKKHFYKRRDDLTKLFMQLQRDLNTQIDKKLLHSNEIIDIQTRAHDLHRCGIDTQRVQAATLVILAKKRVKLANMKSQILKCQIEQVVDLLDYLNTSQDRTDVLPIVDVSKLRKSLPQTSPAIRDLESRIRALKAKSKELVELKPNSGDWYFTLLHPKSRTGKMIERFEARIGQLNYDDIYEIIDHLSSDRDDFSRLEDLLFDIGWQHVNYPFGFVRAPGRVIVPELIPAVLGDLSILGDYAFTPCSILNGIEWPFKSAVDMIFEMMVMTSPFEMGRVFWDVIQEASRCMQRLLIESGKDPSEIDVNFDSLFPVLVMCVFVFGLDEWMTVALYTISFNEQVNDDAQLQFSMTYLESIITHIISTEKQELLQESERLLAERNTL